MMIFFGSFAQWAEIGEMVFVEANKFTNREHVMAKFDIVNLAAMLLGYCLAVDFPIDLV